MPYNKTKMSKRIKPTKPEEFFFRKDRWYQAIAIDANQAEKSLMQIINIVIHMWSWMTATRLLMTQY
ncbi:unnamed protein product (macronuclear) [Paramecium tetraurelia]|uniref:Uncharacterized protein n=1 Tax=Paramecium tetraurelia TaxID=5888 RepID=A0CKG4_PARTE|nr:uncharacterized protein GSPATT00000995001 [Paramecium tetraurelia]CAK71281.1 unnamed protein product [Paramecium tetraurelia]|eukprot:XP_001438678.1 hypothetical protein (macronuclear) [Paramecium tetraurelia strain d4-2]